MMRGEIDSFLTSLSTNLNSAANLPTKIETTVKDLEEGAKIYGEVSLTLQVVSTFSALVMAWIAYQQYSKTHHSKKERDYFGGDDA